ncbi:MAG: glycosyltransferase [Xanthobacteraceae bacterium]
MKLVQINSSDYWGSRFNGFAIRGRLEQRGVESRHLVWRRFSSDPLVELAYDFPLRRYFAWGINQLEAVLAVQSMLHLQWFTLPLHPRFRAADVVHYQILHDGYFSLAALPMLSKAKPSVWTFHDPWAMTGHCIYPMECNRWQTGCGKCPDLTTPFPMSRDHTRFNWRYKKLVYRHTDVDVVVASRWMKEFVAKSPLARGFNIHVVPFGLDLDRFAPGPVETARERLGIFPGHTVIGIRAAAGPYKGVEYFQQALRRIKTDRLLCILTTQEKGVFDEFLGKYQIVELGWTNDEDLLIASHQAADFFVMPSTAEAFGLMAVEAMACGKPVISFEGTSLPEVTFAPEAGLAVPMRDADALAAAITHWIETPEEVRMRGNRAREIAKVHYGIELHLDRLIEVYRKAIGRRAEKLAA